MGVVAAVVGGISSALGAIGITGAAATALSGGLLGAGVGALGSEITGGKPLIGALTGGLTGGAVGGLGGTVGDALGIGATGGDALVGAGAGALGSAVTGGNPLVGALTGGAGGAATGLLGGLGGSDSSGAGAGAAGGANTAALGSAAPAGAVGSGGAGSALSAAPDFSIAGSAPTDLTSGVSASTAGTGAIGAGTGFGGSGELAGLAAPTSSLSSTTGAFAGPTGAVPSGVEGVTPTDQYNFVSSSDSSGSGGQPDTSTTGGTTGTAGGASGGPSSWLPSWLGGSGSGAQASLVNPDGTYVLPPPTPVPEGSTVVDSAGNFVNPGDPNYAPTVNSLNATPVVQAAPASPGTSGVLGSLGISNGQLLGGGIAAAGLGYNLLQKNSIPEESNISNLSNQLQTQSAQLQSYVNNGTLPPGVSTVLTQVQKSMTDQIKAKYAQLGMSGSSAETQDLNNAALQVQSQGATEALNLMNQGVSLTQLSGQLMTTLLNSNTQQNQQTAQSIGNLASALAGGGQTIKLTQAAA
jgi:hypothetical protein